MENIDTGTVSGNDGYEGIDEGFFTDSKKVVKPSGKPQARHSYLSSDESVEQGNPKGGSKEPPQTPVKKETLKIDGEEEEVDPAAFEAKTIKEAEQLKKASYKRMQEAAEFKKTYESRMSDMESRLKEAEGFKKSHTTLENLVEALKKDPTVIFDVAKQFGHDPDSIAEERLYKKWQYANMTDDQRKLQEYEAKVADFEQRELARQEYEKTQAERAKETAMNTAKAEFATAIDPELKDLFAKHGKPDPYTMKDVFQVMHDSILADRPISLLEAHQKVQALRPDSRNKFISGMTDEEIDNLPPEVFERIQARALQKYRSQAVPGRKVTAPSEQRPQQRQKQFAMHDFFDNMDKKNRA